MNTSPYFAQVILHLAQNNIASVAGPHAETGVAARAGPGSYETTPGSTVVIRTRVNRSI